jgi:hypothetical protein
MSRQKPDIYTRLRRNLPGARTVLEQGLADPHGERELAIRAPFPEDLTDAQCAQLIAWTDGAFELGITVGLLLDRGILDPAHAVATRR